MKELYSVRTMQWSSSVPHVQLVNRFRGFHQEALSPAHSLSPNPFIPTPTPWCHSFARCHARTSQYLRVHFSSSPFESEHISTLPNKTLALTLSSPLFCHPSHSPQLTWQRHFSPAGHDLLMRRTFGPKVSLKRDLLVLKALSNFRSMSFLCPFCFFGSLLLFCSPFFSFSTASYFP